ncbi:MAG: aminotransferase class I/II-fold pyridoxal phosphate-dependent enzyme, partial [Promethearchaeota archaeon]
MEFKFLEQTPLNDAFSKLGKRIYLPQGIFYWAGLAKKNAKINATIGTGLGNELEYFDIKEPSQKKIFYLEPLKEYVGKEIEPDKIAGYAPIGGLLSLRKRWKEWILSKTKLGDVKGASELVTLPIVTCGLTNGIFTMVRLFISAGEKVITTDKHWGNYDNIIKLNVGGQVETFSTFKNGKFDIESLERIVVSNIKEQGKAIILLNFPNNPTGYSPTTEEMEDIANTLIKLANEHHAPIVTLCDDAYEGYIYDERAEVRSLFSFLVDKSPYLIPVKLDGASKELLFYGGRVGFITFGLSSEWKSVKEVE